MLRKTILHSPRAHARRRRACSQFRIRLVVWRLARWLARRLRLSPRIRVYAGPGYSGCVVRRWVYTPYGPVLRWVNRCY